MRGKVRSAMHPDSERRDHPRICGEKAFVQRSADYQEGSPPHMRGKAGRGLLGSPHRGITPAYAGKRRRDPLTVPLLEDHPRICGEKVLCPPPSLLLTGSPPHMRGKVIFSRRALRVSGITPAYAGKSSRISGRRTLSRDHPRICGEKHALIIVRVTVIGSPPHMRGKAAQHRFFQ